MILQWGIPFCLPLCGPSDHSHFLSQHAAPVCTIAAHSCWQRHGGVTKTPKGPWHSSEHGSHWPPSVWTHSEEEPGKTITTRNISGSVSSCILQTSQGSTELLVPFHYLPTEGPPHCSEPHHHHRVGSHGAWLLVDAWGILSWHLHTPQTRNVTVLFLESPLHFPPHIHAFTKMLLSTFSQLSPAFCNNLAQAIVSSLICHNLLFSQLLLKPQP